MKNSATNKLNRKKLLWIPAGVIGAAVVSIMGISFYTVHAFFKRAREPIAGRPEDLSLEYEEISFQSADGLKLSGWWMGTDNSDRIIIMVHGAYRNRADPGTKMLNIAKEMITGGYNVLMFDLRGHGLSGGKKTSLGYFEQKDILGAINYAKKRGMKKICILSSSMGAATSLMTAADCDQIDAIVADSSFASLSEIIKPQFSRRCRLPLFFLPVALFLVEKIHGINFALSKPINSIKKINRSPVLLIHGGQDKTVPLEHAYQLSCAAQNTNIHLWVIPEAEHIGAYRARPKEYISRVLSFFDHSICQ
jgi:uncharacterized protein